MSIPTQFTIFVLFLSALLGLAVVQLLHVGSQRMHAAIEPAAHADVTAYEGAVADYFDVQPGAVAAVAERVHPEELPVVFFLARYGLTTPDHVLALRARGASWQQVGTALALGPEAFYFPIAKEPGNAFAATYRKFDLPRDRWSSIRLADDDVVRLVNLRFVTEQTGRDSGDVVALAGRGYDFVSVHTVLEKGQPSTSGRADQVPA